jgi:hypothetical protein
LVELALRTIKNDAADVVILAGSPVSRTRSRIVCLKSRKATVGTYRRPAAKDSKELDSALADVITHR